MSKTLLITASFRARKGGIETYLQKLANELGTEVVVLSPRGENLTAPVQYNLADLPKRHLYPRGATINLILRHMIEHDCDRVLFGSAWPHAVLGRSLKSLGIPYGVIVHGSEQFVAGITPIERQRVKSALRKADLLLPVSEFTAKKLQKFIGDKYSDKIHVLKTTLSIPYFSRDVTVNNSHVTALFVGRLMLRKGLWRLIKASSRLERELPRLRWQVVGGGRWLPMFRWLAEKRGANIEFLGRVSESEKNKAYEQADLFVFPVADRFWGLDVEGLGLTTVEAALYDLPAIVGKSGGTPETVDHLETGHLIDARNNEQLDQAVRHLVRNRNERLVMGQRAKLKAINDFAARPLPEAFANWLRS